VLQPGEGVDGNPALKASRRSTLGSLSITDSVTTGGAPPHQHRYDDEVFYVLEGVLLVTMDGQEHRITPGGVAFIPREIPHAWDTDGEARLLIITAPGGLEEFLAALHTWPAGYGDAWRVLGERHGYELL
jgi:mannose-6-phosphate isomerase-like protein (cupin superfamily)